ncbi:MAG: hypothetical protein IJX14_00045 [Clostridia bacterium]|nr:hypothetical protein [Clostridia bacterium]
MNEQLTSHTKPPKPVHYALLTLLTHLILSILLIILFGTSYLSNLPLRHGICLWIVFLVPLFVICKYYFLPYIPEQYREGGALVWLKTFVKLVLPGEIIRFVLSAIPLGSMPLGNFLSPFSWILTEKLYLYPQLYEVSTSEAAIRVTGMTFGLYPLFYVFYLVLTYLPVLLVVHRYAWKKGQKEYEKLKKIYAEHEADAQARDAMPDAAAKVIPEHKEKAFDLYNTFRGKRPKK